MLALSSRGAAGMVRLLKVIMFYLNLATYYSIGCHLTLIYHIIWVLWALTACTYVRLRYILVPAIPCKCHHRGIFVLSPRYQDYPQPYLKAISIMKSTFVHVPTESDTMIIRSHDPNRLAVKIMQWQMGLCQRGAC